MPKSKKDGIGKQRLVKDRVAMSGWRSRGTILNLKEL